nr:immunoglobulin heavy chain junction region [Mus musculus]
TVQGKTITTVKTLTT